MAGAARTPSRIGALAGTALALGLALAACDDGRTVITRTARLPALALDDLPALTQHGAVPVEVHGTPFAGVDAAALAEALRPPAGSAQSTRFRALPEGAGGAGFHGDRLVLHFNPLGAPNGPQDCRLPATVATAPPAARGFRVMLTFCEGGDWQAHGYLEALDTEPGDLDAYSRAMQTLISAIFADTTDPDDRR